MRDGAEGIESGRCLSHLMHNIQGSLAPLNPTLSPILVCMLSSSQMLMFTTLQMSTSRPTMLSLCSTTPVCSCALRIYSIPTTCTDDMNCLALNRTTDSKGWCPCYCLCRSGAYDPRTIFSTVQETSRNVIGMARMEWYTYAR